MGCDINSKVGDELKEGDIYAKVQETQSIMHKIMVPPEHVWQSNCGKRKWKLQYRSHSSEIDAKMKGIMNLSFIKNGL